MREKRKKLVLKLILGLLIAFSLNGLVQNQVQADLVTYELYPLEYTYSPGGVPADFDWDTNGKKRGRAKDNSGSDIGYDDNEINNIYYRWDVGHGHYTTTSKPHTGDNWTREDDGAVMYGYGDDKVWRKTMTQGLVTNADVGNRHIAGAWYFVVSNTRSTSSKSTIVMYGPGHTSADPGRVTIEDTIPGNTNRMYIFQPHTAGGSYEVTDLGSVDLELNDNGTIKKKKNMRTLMTICHCENSSARGTDIGLSGSGKVNAGFAANVYDTGNGLGGVDGTKYNFQIVQASSKVIIGEWVQSTRYQIGKPLSERDNILVTFEYGFPDECWGSPWGLVRLACQDPWKEDYSPRRPSADAYWQWNGSYKLNDDGTVTADGPNEEGGAWFKVGKYEGVVLKEAVMQSEWKGLGTQIGRISITVQEQNGEVSVKKYIDKVNDKSVSSSRENMTIEDKLASPVEVDVGDKVTYNIEITSTIPEDVYVKVNDIIPEDSYYVEASSDKIGIDAVPTTAGNIKVPAEGKKILTVTTRVSAYADTRENADPYENKAELTEVKSKADGTDFTDCITVSDDSDYYTVAATEGVKVKKYISKVENKDGGVIYEETAQNTRANLSTNQKSNSKVKVERGDKITYTIEVINDYKFKVKAKIKEEKPNCSRLLSFVDSSNKKVTTTPAVSETSSSNETDEFEINANSSKKFYVQIQVSEAALGGSSNYYENKVTLTSATNTLAGQTEDVNILSYSAQTTDSDYHKVKKYDVSIQKYITSFTRRDNTTSYLNTTDNVRDVHSIITRDESTTSVTEAETFKENNPVEVENGDVINYDIIVYNTCSTTNTEISPEYCVDPTIGPYYEPSYVNVDINDTIPSGAYHANITGIEENQWTQDKNVLKIRGVQVAAGSTLTIHVSLKVYYVQEDAVANTAAIVGLKNKNNYNITDMNCSSYKTSKDWHTVTGIIIDINKYIIETKTNNDGTGVFSSEERSTLQTSAKADDPLKVEVGDYIKYQIDVSAGACRTIKIKLKDILPTGCDLVTVTGASNTLFTSGGEEIEIVSGQVSSIIVRVRVNNSSSTGTRYSNRVELVKNTDGSYYGTMDGVDISGSIATYQDYDEDYHYVKAYSVSIEKYICNVRHASDSFSEDIDRSVYTLNSMDATAVETAKAADPVKVEVGDYVTYKIIVYNTPRSGVFSVPDAAATEPYFSPGKVYVSFTDSLPGDIGEVSYSPTRDTGVTINGTSTVAFTDIEITEGSTQTFYITVRVKATTSSTVDYTNTVTINNIKNINKTSSESDSIYYTVSNNTSFTSSCDYYTKKKYSVSIEKYICNSRHFDGDSTLNDARSRSELGESSEQDKSDDPVKVEVGDYITYKIIVYNTTESGSFSVDRDGTPWYNPDDVYVSFTDYLPADASDVIITPTGSGTTNSAETEVTFSNVHVEAGDSTTLYITIRALKGTSLSYNNRVQINSIRDINLGTDNDYCLVTNLNDSDAQTESKDYHVIKEYSVSIEKYICNSRHYNGNNTISDNRSWSQLGSSAEQDKSDDSVKVEIGDYVTYKIIVYNTTGSGTFSVDREGTPWYEPYKVYVNFTDTLPANASFVSVTPDTPSTTGTPGNARINDDGTEVVFTNIPIDEGGTVSYKVTIRVLRGASLTYENSVAIDEIRNINRTTNTQAANDIYCLVNDLNTSTNTESSDWYTIKKYKVSIEKYICDVEHVGGAFLSSTARSTKELGLSIAEGKKYDSAEGVEIGDTVYYKIILYNTTENTDDPFKLNSGDRGKDPYFSPNLVYVDFKDELPPGYSNVVVSTLTSPGTSSLNYVSRECDIPKGTYSISEEGEIQFSNIIVPEGDITEITLAITVEKVRKGEEICENNVTIQTIRDINRTDEDTGEVDEFCVVDDVNTPSGILNLNVDSARRTSSDWYEIKRYNVSVDKYIYDVQHVGPGTYSDNTKAANDTRKASSLIANTGIPSVTDEVTAETYKQNNPVPIEVEDKVYYKLVFSNKASPLTSSRLSPPADVFVDLTDYLPEGYENLTIESITPTYTGHNYTHEDGDDTFSYTLLRVPSNSTRTVYISLTTTDIGHDANEPNEVNIDEVHNINTMATKDRPVMDMNDATVTDSKDWFIFKHYAVQPEKYIQDVAHQHGTVTSSLDTTYNEDSSDKRLDMEEEDKEDFPVYVEYGDEVTYKIEIHNTTPEATTWPSSPYYKPDDVYVYFEDTLPLAYSNLKVYDGDTKLEQGTGYTLDSGKIRIERAQVGPHATKVYTIKLTVEEHVRQTVEVNTVKLVKFLNVNEFEAYVAEGTTTDTKLYNRSDKVISSDWYEINDYAVEIDNFISEYNEVVLRNNNEAHFTSEVRVANDTTNILKVSRENTTDTSKKNVPLSVEKGETIKYNIKVRNQAEPEEHDFASGNKPATQIRSVVIEDYLEQGLRYTAGSLTAQILNISNGSLVQNNVEASGGITVTGPTAMTLDDGRKVNKYILTLADKYVIDPGQELVITIPVSVIETNMYLFDLMNHSKITHISNINELSGVTRRIKNETYDENILASKEESKEYVRMKDLVIAGSVWVDMNGDGLMNDTATDREKVLYNLNEDSQKKDVTVKLYKKSGESDILLRTTKTDSNGLYTFANKKDLTHYATQYSHSRNSSNNLVSTYLASTTYQRIDKATDKDSNGNYQSTSRYIEYFIEFEYDGTVFRTTKYRPNDENYTTAGMANLKADGDYFDEYTIDSNAGEFSTKRTNYNNRHEYISYDSTYSDEGTTKTADLEFLKENHESELMDRKDIDSSLDGHTERLMSARSFIRTYNKADVLSAIRTAMNSCGADRWKQCSNHWRHWQTVIEMQIINPDDYDNTHDGRKRAQNYLKSIYDDLASSTSDVTELTQYLWLYKYDDRDESVSGYTTPLTDYLKYVNCGLLLREDVDISLTKDVYEVILTINGERLRYKIHDTDIVRTATVSDIVNYLIDKPYVFELYESDYKYRVDQYPAQAVKDYKTDQTELNIEVIYKMTIQNENVVDNPHQTGSKDTKLGVKIHEILDLYDENFITYSPEGKVTVKIREKDDEEKTEGFYRTEEINVGEAWYYDGAEKKDLVLSDTAQFVEKGDDTFNQKLSDSGYKKLYIRPSTGNEIFIPEKTTGESGKFDMYIKYVVDKTSLDIIVNNNEYIEKYKNKNKEGFREVEEEYNLPSGTETVTIYKQTLDRSLKIGERCTDAGRAMKNIYGRSTENIAQIHAYSVWYTSKNASDKYVPTKKAALVDKDGNAGDIGDSNTVVTIDDTTGEATSIVRKHDGSIDDGSLYEDNTYKTGIDIVAEGTENRKKIETTSSEDPTVPTPPAPEPIPDGGNPEEQRLMSGFVWDDARTEEVVEENKGTQYIGDGIYDGEGSYDEHGTYHPPKAAKPSARKNAVVGSKFLPKNSREANTANYVNENKDIKVEGASVEFVEIQKIKVGDEVRYYEQIMQDVTWAQERTTRTRSDGTFTLKGYMPGRYIVRFVYGDTIETATDAKTNMLIYNGQDYKSTQYLNTTDRDGLITITESGKEEMKINKVLSALKTENRSDARDDEVRRLEVNGYSETMYNQKAEILKGIGTASSIDKTLSNVDDNNILTDPEMNEQYRLLTDNTNMRADTMEFYSNVEDVSFGTIRIDNPQVKEYEIENIDFGLEYRPESEVSLQMDLDEIKITSSSGKVIMDLIIDTIIDHTKNSITEHRVNLKKSIGTEYVQFVSNTYEKELHSSTEQVQGLANLQVDKDILQGSTISTIYRVFTENNSEIDRVSKALTPMKYKDDLPAGVTPRYLAGTGEYSASLTAGRLMYEEYYSIDDNVDSEGNRNPQEYRHTIREYSSEAGKGYYGRYVGHTYYIGDDGKAADDLTELKVSKIASYVDNNYVYTQTDTSDLNNKLWAISDEEDIQVTANNTYEFSLGKYISVIGKKPVVLGENGKVADDNKELKDSNGIAYQGIATSIDDRTTSDTSEETEELVKNKALSKYLFTRTIYGNVSDNDNEERYAGYIYLPVSRVISAESEADELQFVNTAEIVEYMTLTGRRTNFESTVGDMDMSTSKDTYKADVYPKALVANRKTGTSEFLSAAMEIDSAASEGIYLIPPTGLDRKMRVIVDVVETTKTGIEIVVIGAVIVLILGAIIGKHQIGKGKKKKNIV